MKYRKTIILAAMAFFLQLTALFAAFSVVWLQRMVMTTVLYPHKWDIFWIPPVTLFLFIGYPLILYGIYWRILVRASKRQTEVKIIGIVFVVVQFLLQIIVGNIEAHNTMKLFDRLPYESMLRDVEVTIGELHSFYNIVSNVGRFFGSLAFAVFCIAAGSALMIEKQRKS